MTEGRATPRELVGQAGARARHHRNDECLSSGSGIGPRANTHHVDALQVERIITSRWRGHVSR
jgi:hypothetical protein